ncbi:hypothetical protein H696_01861 [Fonticula alba]|uniref:Secreted protein n=1 Tax=Fonticula alba TaxID=691883 RepID=A0A058Z9G8_FONAL|nr:hypothetical protein H696_01861 [Fonticula alba]KCV70915.1 hypothetical protein H696_01861 [Fonticula alba]|eukprot:XP_009494038.1 hypothetical protein H696_01861 [Fonticula alba]
MVAMPFCSGWVVGLPGVVPPASAEAPAAWVPDAGPGRPPAAVAGGLGRPPAAWGRNTGTRPGRLPKGKYSGKGWKVKVCTGVPPRGASAPSVPAPGRRDAESRSCCWRCSCWAELAASAGDTGGGWFVRDTRCTVTPSVML